MRWQDKIREVLARNEASRKFRRRSSMWFRRAPGKPGFYKFTILQDNSGSFTPEEMGELLKGFTPKDVKETLDALSRLRGK